MSMRSLSLTAVLSIALLLSAACGGSTVDGKSSGTTNRQVSGPIRLAYVVPDWTALAKALKDPTLDPPKMIVSAKKEFTALVAWANKNGGVGGRRIEAKPYTIDQYVTPDQMTKYCDQMAEDDRREVVIDASIFTAEQGWQCMADHKMAYTGIATATDSTFLKSVAPYIATTYATIDTQMKALASLAKTAGFLDGAKVGVLLTDLPVMHRNYEQAMKPAFAAAGVPAPQVKYITSNDQAQTDNAVLGFKSAGVSRIFMLTSVVDYLNFSNQAQSQNYHPRYGFSDYQAMVQVASQYGSPRQNAGAIGVSSVVGPSGIAADASRVSSDRTSPYEDDQVTPGFKSCMSILSGGVGTDYMNPGQAGASTFQASYCDGFMLWLDSARKIGAGWTPERFGQGLAALGSSYASSRMASVDFSAGSTGGPVTFGLGEYSAKCKCFVKKLDFMRP
ncbi:hypothetical protein [Actinoallomurus acaciae]|uniref:Leucine-binding protein domain-containing protein n=1 Tax=Actinoallomurus acaciae TaxID=502577 RepID=A0ABV5YAT6_9ACTN